MRGLGATALPAAFIAEGLLWVYLHQLDHHSTAALWCGIGAARRIIPFDQLKERGWLAVTLPAALVGEVLVSVVYHQSFA